MGLKKIKVSNYKLVIICNVYIENQYYKPINKNYSAPPK